MANIHPSRRSLPRTHKTEEALKDEGFITMRELARETGLARTYLIAMEKEGVFRPALLGIGATLYFKKDETVARLEEQKILRPSSMKKAGVANGVGAYVAYTGEQAAKVFEAMEQGLSEIQVVVKKGIHPTIVSQAAIEYRRLKEEIIVTRDRLKIINALPLDGNFPITSADELVDLLRGCAVETSCDQCRKRPRTICEPCSIKVAKKYAATAD